MPIERERKFMVNLDQAHQLTDGLTPTHITQHYLSPTNTPYELRVRRAASDFADPSYTTTVKQGYGEYRHETEVPLRAESYQTLGALSLGSVFKNRFGLYQPGLTLDTYRQGPARLFGGILELEQTAATPDIGLFDPTSLGVGNFTEITGLPDISNRNLATIVEQKEQTMPPTASFEQIIGMIDSKQQADRPTIITLSGPSGSGKTTILDKFRAQYGASCTTISTDDYYIGKTLMRSRMPEGHTENFDHPAAIDTARLASHLQALSAGHSIEKPLYDMKRSEPINFAETITPNSVIIVEGIAANLPQVRAASDLSLLITAPMHTRLQRRIARDTTRKGYSAEQTLGVFMNHVEPSYQTYYAEHDSAVDYQIAPGSTE